MKWCSDMSAIVVWPLWSCHKSLPRNCDGSASANGKQSECGSFILTSQKSSSTGNDVAIPRARPHGMCFTLVVCLK
jgi:hypothetical protein